MKSETAQRPSFSITRNPATGEIIARTPELDPQSLREVLARARTAQPGWSAMPLKERRRLIAAVRHLLLERADDLSRLIADCVGKTRVEALATEVMPTVGGSGWYERHAEASLAPRRLRSGSLLFLNKHSTIYRLPWGVVGIIAPWNYPLGIPMHEIVPALLAGNTVVFKTAPETVPVGVAIEALFQDAGLPADVFAHVNIDGPVCGDIFLEKDGVDKLFFTGSVEVGKLLMAKAAGNLIPVSLELGGKDAMIVRADADLHRAAEGALWAGLSNAGQSCAGVERIYVQAGAYDRFLEILGRKLETLRVGIDRNHDVDIGSICTERQLKKIQSQLDDALARGARVYARAPLPDSPTRQFVAPMVLVDVDHKMTIMREETFGPILGVMPFGDDDEAVELANDSVYGLTSSVWSRDVRKAVRLGRRIRAGAVTINDHLLSHGLTETPWGGFKVSGIGRGHGHFAFEEATAVQVVVGDWLGFLPRNPFWHPYSRGVYEGLRGILTALYGSGIARRVRGFLRFLPLIPRMIRKPR